MAARYESGRRKGRFRRAEGRRTGCDAVFVDLTDEKSVERVFGEIKEKFGRLDVLINCAGIISFEKFDRQDCGGWDRVMNVNIRGTCFCCRLQL